MKSLIWYIEMYEKHTGERFVPKEPFSFYYSPEHGFCEYHVAEDTLYIWQMCGDLKHWINLAYEACQVFHLKYIASFIVRKPLPFIRRLGFKIESTEDREGCKRYHCKNRQGESLTATQWGDRYIFTWEVKLNEVKENEV